MNFENAAGIYKLGFSDSKTKTHSFIQNFHEFFKVKFCIVGTSNPPVYKSEYKVSRHL